MIIHAISACVDYAPLLERAIDRWIAATASFTVVTCGRDEATIELAWSRKANLLVTEAFYEDGAFFNKGRAIEQARAGLPRGDWHLLVDADVIPPTNWIEQLCALGPRSGSLYGACRVFEDGRPVGDQELAGFFQLYHSLDSRAQEPLGRDWLHAGNYDSEFMFRWPSSNRQILPIVLTHLGETGKNWCGKGNEAAMKDLFEQRKTRSWQTEKVAGGSGR